MNTRGNHRLINFQFNYGRADAAKVDEVCHQWGLPRSEILRRAVRIGLVELTKVTVPGSPSTAKPNDDAHDAR